MGKIKVVELFAGVGGFHLGLQRASKDFEILFSNQWEPNKSENSQFAFKALTKNFKNSNAILSNQDIAIAKFDIPVNFDLLVGGFPCQDYSVASTQAKGINGKKGVLWWEIAWVLENRAPKFVLLENVDRLLKSPANLRGRDFAIMLMTFNRLGYNVEWRVIDASKYGEPQRRKRIFIFAEKKELNTFFDSGLNIEKNMCFFDETFKIERIETEVIKMNLAKEFKDEFDITNNWMGKKFNDAGVMILGNIYSTKFSPIFRGKIKTLGEILENSPLDNKSLLLSKEELKKIKYLKGSKKIERIRPDGKKYFYAEGNMNIFDDLSKPARTMLTSESTLNRSSHFIIDKNGNNRRISPIEAERLNGFPDNWTSDVMSDKMRYFCMGNALVVPLITKIGRIISKKIAKNEK